MNTDLITVLQDLYRSEINVEISSFWDGGWDVSLGDRMNGYEAVQTFRNDELGAVASWLTAAAIRAYPNSNFAKKVAV